jgi:hypothetical protein
MNAYVRLFCVCVALCAVGGLATGWSRVQRVLQTLNKTKKLKKADKAQQWSVEPLIIIIQFNSILYYLCAESTATRPITDTAQRRYNNNNRVKQCSNNNDNNNNNNNSSTSKQSTDIRFPTEPLPLKKIIIITTTIIIIIIIIIISELRGLRPRANYTDLATAACQIS